MQVTVNFREKGNPSGKVVHTENIDSAATFSDALLQARNLYSKGTWHSMEAANGRKVTLVQVRKNPVFNGLYTPLD